jgi:hydroxypyruvate isomerase
MSRNPKTTRRTALRTAGAGLAGALVARGTARAENAPAVKGNIRQSVSRWCYNKVPLDKLCEECKRIGYLSIELLNPDDALAVKKAGLTCALLNCAGVSIAEGFNRTENHEKIIAGLKKTIDFAAENGFPNVITFSGNRKGMSDDEGATNCIAGLKQVAGYAEEKKVTIILELLNSKVNHKDYMADRTEWGATVCKGVGSERVKLLYDIYHMQIMEGDVIATLRKFKDSIGHYHTGGVPGRNEIDETQELYYPAIMKAIVETGYKGFVGQEFVPKRDPLTSMAQAFKICDV